MIVWKINMSFIAELANRLSLLSQESVESELAAIIEQNLLRDQVLAIVMNFCQTWSFFILLIPFLLWSYFAKLEQISRANGQVIAVSKKQAIQSANDGVVKDIYVKEGQLVKKVKL